MEDTFTFSYIAKKDFAPKTATGIEHTWLDLELEVNRQGKGLPGARYFKTISKERPQLFAVKNDQGVYYHDENKWHRFQTAADMKYDKIHSLTLDSQNQLATLQSNDDDSLGFSVEDGIK